GAPGAHASASSSWLPRRARTTTRRMAPSERPASGGSSMARASVTYAVPEATRASSAGSCARMAPRTSMPGSTSTGLALMNTRIGPLLPAREKRGGGGHVHRLRQTAEKCRHRLHVEIPAPLGGHSLERTVDTAGGGGLIG